MTEALSLPTTRTRGPADILQWFLAGVMTLLVLATTALAAEVGYRDVDGQWRFIDESQWPTAGKDLKAFTQRSRNTDIDFEVTFMDVVNGTNTGFADPTYGADRRAVVWNVLNYIDSVMNESGGCQLEFQNSRDLGGNTLATGGPFFFTTNVFNPPLTVAHIITGGDPSGQVPDITLTFDFGNPFYAGTGACPSNQFDLFSVMLHEICHGLGIITYANANGTGASGAKVFSTWDNLLYTGAGVKVWDSSGNLGGSTSILTGSASGIFFRGTQARAAFGGNYPPIYTPNPFATGSSLSHWDNSAGASPVMVYARAPGEMTRSFVAIEIGALGDLGYDMGAAVNPTPTFTPTNTPTPLATSTPFPPPTPTATPTPPGGGDGPIRDLITSFYQVVLGRDPEAGAVDAWEQGYFNYAASFNIDVRFIPREMGRLFFLSQEYAGRARTDAQFIGDCYLVFLERSPGTDELNGWLSGSWNRPEAVTIFAESDEFAQRIQTMYPGMSGDAVRNFITTMYIGLLDRLVDQGGLEASEDAFDATSDKRKQAKLMALNIIASDEFLAKGPTALDYVTRFYRTFLGRFPNDEEAKYWTDRLTSGEETYASLIETFGNSAEFTQRIVEYFGAPPVDLRPYKPTDWDGYIYLSNTTGTNSGVVDIYANQTAWIDYAVANYGQAETGAGFHIRLEDLTTGEDIRYGFRSNTLEAFYFYEQEDIPWTFTQTGWHDLRLTVDSDQEISETDETNNTVTTSVYVR